MHIEQYNSYFYHARGPPCDIRAPKILQKKYFFYKCYLKIIFFYTIAQWCLPKEVTRVYIRVIMQYYLHHLQIQILHRPMKRTFSDLKIVRFFKKMLTGSIWNTRYLFFFSIVLTGITLLSPTFTRKALDPSMVYGRIGKIGFSRTS